MNFQLVILQAAMGAGFLIIYGGTILFLLLSIGYTAMFFHYVKGKLLQSSVKTNMVTLYSYLISLTIGFFIAALTLGVLLELFIVFYGDASLD